MNQQVKWYEVAGMITLLIIFATTEYIVEAMCRLIGV
jgi:hypothetical protein